MKPNTQPPVDSKDEELRKKITELLGDDYACTRVWEAWQVGTMTQEDFEPLNETTRVDELIELFKQYGIQERIDEVRMFREAMTFSHTTPSIHESNRIAELTALKGDGVAKFSSVAPSEGNSPDPIEQLYIESSAIGLVEFRGRIQAIAIRERKAGHEKGYIHGVSDFSGYYMDASVPAQRNMVMPHIAIELINGYKSPIYSELNALKDKQDRAA